MFTYCSNKSNYRQTYKLQVIGGTFLFPVVKPEKSVEYRVRGLVTRPLEIENPFLLHTDIKSLSEGYKMPLPVLYHIEGFFPST